MDPAHADNEVGRSRAGRGGIRCPPASLCGSVWHRGKDRPGWGEFTGGHGQGWDGGSGKRLWVSCFGPASVFPSVKWAQRHGSSIVWNVLVGSGEHDSDGVIQESPGISGNVLEEAGEGDSGSL